PTTSSFQLRARTTATPSPRAAPPPATGETVARIRTSMARRIGKRDVLWLSMLSGAFVVLAVQLFLGSTNGFDRPHRGLFARLLEAPGIVLGWGGVALCVVAIPYALVSWTRGR